jgi:hypothetical protein
MWATAVRLLARTNPNPSFKSRSSLGKKKATDPKVPPEEALRLAGILHNVLHENGPLTVAACWSHAQVSEKRSRPSNFGSSIVQQNHIEASQAKSEVGLILIDS